MVGFQKGDRVGELRIGHGLPPPCTVLPVEVASHASVPSEPFAKAESAVEVRIGSGGRIVRRWSAAFPPAPGADLILPGAAVPFLAPPRHRARVVIGRDRAAALRIAPRFVVQRVAGTAGRAFRLRSEEHTSELQSLMRISYAVFCLKKKNNNQTT